ncbi:glycosyltransferase family 39 protein [bacterium]|nr:glycosyltransferase family 39 protein [bacterium]
MNSHSVLRRRISRQNVIIWLTLFLLAAAALRVVGLGRPSFWVDETNAFYASKSLAESGNFELPSGREYKRAPVQTAVTALLFKILPANEFSTRLPAAVMGILSVLLVYFLTARIFNQRVALVAVFFMAFSHFEVGWSRTARMYTFLQFFTLLFFYFLVRFLETRRGERMEAILWIKGESPLIRLRHFITRWGLSLGWVLPIVIIFIVAYQGLHQLAVFLPLCLMAYLGFMMLIGWLSFKGKERWLNKYSLLFLMGSMIGAVLIVLVPQIRQSLPNFFNYTPPWAVTGSASDRLMLINFLMEPSRFPLGALFFMGGVQVLTRYHRKGILTLFYFVVPLLALSFVFTHRTQTYLFFVYPFFLILAAYALVNIIEVESRVSKGILKRLEPAKNFIVELFKRHIAILITLAFSAVFLFSPWLRFTQSIPRNPDGMTNGAVTNCEWRGGMELVASQWQQGDLLLSSLPVSSFYYGRAADYAINWSLLNQAKDKQFANNQNQWIDVYAGVPCIESLESLEQLVRSNPRGWIIIEHYQLESAQYIPADVREWLESELSPGQTTPLNTIDVFSWDNTEGS